MSETVTNWLNSKFLAWEQSQGKRQTISAFAKYLGVPQPSLSNWMAGTHEPSGENLYKIAKILGNEIYEIMGITEYPILSSDPLVNEIAEAWEYLPEATKDEIRKIYQDAKEKEEKRRKRKN